MTATLPSFERRIGESAQTTARITRVKFANHENGYAILEAVTRKRINFVMVGTLAMFKVDDEVRVKGTWVDSKYGIQLKVESCEIALPTSGVGLARFLSSQITGIGMRMAERIIEKFGDDTIRIFDNEPEKLLEIKGISPKKLELIKQEWLDKQGSRQIFVYLQGHGLSFDLSAKLINIYGNKIIPILTQQPYLLAKEVNGIGFKRADQIAMQMGIAQDAPMRIEAGIDYALYDAENTEGHCYLPKPILIDAAAKLLQIPPAAIEPHIQALIERRNIRTEKDDNGETIIYRKFMWHLENNVATEIVRMVNTSSHNAPNDDDFCLVKKIETKLGIELADTQREAVLTTFYEKFMVITGGPGTGKTTLVKVIVAAAQEMDIEIFLAAPTGRAAKRLNETTGHDAKTIHRLLEYTYFEDSHGAFTRNDENQLPPGIYIIDEASMIDLNLMRSLLRAMPDQARVIFVGDVDQLPSVGTGTVLKDLIASKCLPVIRLKTVFRQAEQSLIVQNAHRINDGLYPIIPSREQMGDIKCEFFFFNAPTPEQAERMIQQLVVEKLPKRFNLNPMTDIQVLCPMRMNIGGVEHVNNLLQAHLNPNGHPLEKCFQGFRVGDRVMQLRNDYDKEVFNGDIGTILSDTNRNTRIDFDGRTIEYKRQDLENLALAYACTVHKSQGSEYPAVICAFLRSQSFMLQRNLVYTALTRARRIAIFITDDYTLKCAIENNRPSARFTRLAHRIAQILHP
ncbi:MAG: ATP-dependent RecD-like DNA helicase [Proteobacteria bacterium]|nr:ATP-dependent RecD-like DNA helicase [Pseudomonadota bacterium]